MIHLDSDRFDAIAHMLGDTPFTVTPYFFLRCGECDVYVDEAAQPRSVVIFPRVQCADVYVFVLSTLNPQAVKGLAIYFAEKLGMEEIGTTGREVYLQPYPAC